jgi:hypothetical protein
MNLISTTKVQKKVETTKDFDGFFQKKYTPLSQAGHAK